jgi:hypothetical protein
MQHGVTQLEFQPLWLEFLAGLLDPTVDRDFDGVSVPCIISLANEVTHFGRGSALSRVYGWPLMSDIGYEQKSVQVVSRWTAAGLFHCFALF